MLFVASKIWLGIALAMPIGPVSIEMIKRGLSQGFLASFSIRLGGAVGNLLCLLLACLGLSYLQNSPFLVHVLSFVGGTMLFTLGYQALTKEVNLESNSKGALKSGLLWGFYLAVFNPVALVFWPGIFAHSVEDISSIGLRDFFQNSFIILGVLLWGATLSLLASLGKKSLDKKKAKIITKASGLILVLYSFNMFYKLIEKVYFS